MPPHNPPIISNAVSVSTQPVANSQGTFSYNVATSNVTYTVTPATTLSYTYTYDNVQQNITPTYTTGGVVGWNTPTYHFTSSQYPLADSTWVELYATIKECNPTYTADELIEVMEKAKQAAKREIKEHYKLKTEAEKPVFVYEEPTFDRSGREI